MKTGSEPRGIVAHGKVVRQSYEAPHYDSEKAAAGKTAPHIDVEFDGIRNYTTESILQIDTLTQTFPEQTWIPQSSGIQIKCDVDELQKMWNELQGNQIITDMDKYIELLKANHNLILTGAPGTGKTYLAKQIAEAMGCTENEIGFVQFHPSYDYTDFVEGLRPLNDDSGNVGFERKDGVFKTFCAKALENLLDSQKSLQTLQQETSVRDLIEDFVQDAIESDIKLETQGTRNVFHIIENKAKHITIDIPKNEKTRVISLPKSDLITLLENKVEISGSKDIQLYFQRKYRTQQDSYTYVLYEKLKSLKSNAKVETISLIPKKNYVFIIDEINRGEISKIFGELFFSIDPGYRGESGRVDTQYQNMVEDGDVFKKGFFVPENVYIIGTMNDIDRSVESMDFAMRRRFAWKEVSADDSMQMLDGMANANEMKARMTSLNKAILAIKELGKAYQIGAAYFKKYELYNDFNKLWEYHLEGVLREYLRGNPNAEEQLKELKKAYDIESATDESDDTNE
ncbi:MAG: AAA family ATPase [Salinivirgaceae bacterium]|nr:AAA family ATPase [Salinivirgaceae bacterium]